MSSKHEPSRWVNIASGSLAGLFLCAVVWACGSVADPVDADPDGGGGGPGTKDGARPEGSTAEGDTGTTPTSGATDPNLKVAFIGDTGTTNDFKKVLQLIVREKADLVVIQGDLTYGLPPFGVPQTSPATWFTTIDNEINKAQTGSNATVTIPYFAAKGNHDNDWNGLGGGLKTRMTTWGAPPENGDPTTNNYSVVYKGLKMVMVDDSETTPSRADYVNQRLENDDHIWKICSWHKNMRASNVGPKNDEMGWGIYENCRTHGAIVAQAHSHTYSRSKTLTKDADQTVDPACSDPFALCVGPGKHFFFDSSVGGQDTRPLDNGVAGRPYWASTYTGGFGALFITFHVDGDPKKAAGYFKTVDDVVIDPPAASGKTTFTITKSP